MFKKLIVCASLCGLASVALPSTAAAGTCGSVASVSSDLFKEYNSLASQIPYIDKVDKMITFWNSMAGNSWAKIGPRRLEYGKTMSGTVTGPTSRVFIAETPSDMKQADVTIKKLDGKAKTSITVCKVDASGNQQKVWDFTVENGNGTETFTRTVKGLEGKLLTVHINGHSATNSFKYTVRANKKNP